jgi:serine/threonine-protein kinase
VWDGAPYLVMEYVVGHARCARLMDDGALPPSARSALTARSPPASRTPTRRAIAHRDVKPANIMISEEIGTGEHVRILDFGLARLRGAVGRDATQANVVVGTPNYMAPEQTVGGGLIDARTDIYAVGVVLFEMICGDRPFTADDTLALLGMHRAAPIPRLTSVWRATSSCPTGCRTSSTRRWPSRRVIGSRAAIELAEAIDEVAAAYALAQGGAPASSCCAVAPTRGRPSAARPRCSTSAMRPGSPHAPPRGRDQPRGSFMSSLLFVALLLGSAGAACGGSSIPPAPSRPRDRR